MPSTRFTPLNQSDDYRLDDFPHSPPQYNPATYQQQVYQQQLHQQQQQQHAQVPPPAWQSSAHEKLTYVSTPTEYFSDPKPYRQDGKDERRRSSRLSFLGKANPVSNLKIPRFAAPWQHEEIDTVNLTTRSNTVRYFDRNKQWWRLFVNGLLQWFMTVGIVGVICITLRSFSTIKPLENWWRYTFNAIMTLLSLCISLSIVSALRSYAKLLSWRFLATEYRDLQDFELIMNCHSQSKVLKLLWAGRSPGKFRLNRTQLLCISSLSLVIGLQIVIALMGLTYSTDSSSKYIGHVHGNVSLVDLSDIRQSFITNTDDGSEYLHRAGAANYYGSAGSDYHGYYGVPGESQWDKDSNYTGPESIGVPNNNLWGGSYFYQFGEWSNHPEHYVFGETKRYVETSATCTMLNITAGGTVNDTYVDYYDEFGVNRTQYLGNEIATYTTTYMTNTSEVGCGPRCSRLLVIDVGSYAIDNITTYPDDYWPPVLWACNSTLSKVYNSNRCRHEENCTLSDELARIAAGAIGLSGVEYTDEDMQYQLYPQASRFSYAFYGNESDDPMVRASLIAWFSAAVIAAMDDSGPRISVPGDEPRPGMVLQVQWKLTIPVLAIVPTVQLIVLIIVCLYANGAMVKDGSYLSTARLLRPIVEKLEHHGCALTGDEIARELGNFKVIYGARAPRGRGSSSAYTPAAETNVDWHSGIIFESEGFGQQAAEGWLPGRVWPAGRYDGVGYPDEEQARPELPPRQRKGLQPIMEEFSDEDYEDVTDEKSHLL